jgi:hypothetical protein
VVRSRVVPCDPVGCGADAVSGCGVGSVCSGLRPKVCGFGSSMRWNERGRSFLDRAIGAQRERMLRREIEVEEKVSRSHASIRQETRNELAR